MHGARSTRGPTNKLDPIISTHDGPQTPSYGDFGRCGIHLIWAETRLITGFCIYHPR